MTDTGPTQVAAGEVADGDASAYGVLSTTERFAGRVISVYTDEVEMPGGGTAERDIVRHPGAVGVLALDDEDRVLLVRQYRHAVRRHLWEPPAGLLDVAGERAELTAARELYEEAGYRAARWHVLADYYTTPGMCDEALRLFLARDLTPVDTADRFAGEHEEADMPMAWVPLDDAVDLVLSGRLHNPTGVVGILAAAAARARGWETLRTVDMPWPERPTHSA
ncbi:MAG: hydrolase [Frankiales bacterium]|nr:hydrolase [Frankiales bacterium]